MTVAEARIVAVCVGEARPLPHDASLVTGYLKARQHGPVRVTRAGLAGDAQAARTVHGGPDRAVLAYAASHYALWRAELGDRAPAFGGFAENLTVDGLDDATACVGDRVRAGTAVLEVSLPRKPCEMISRATRVDVLYDRVEATGRWGWLHRVLEDGDVAEGDALVVLDRPFPDWPVSRAAAVMDAMRAAPDAATLDAARALASVASLGEAWRAKLMRRLAGAD